MLSQSPPIHNGQISCRLCGRPMDANLASMRNSICRAPACDAERTREAARAIQERDWNQYRNITRDRLERAAPAIAVLSEQVGIEVPQLKTQMLPRQMRPMGPPDAKRRAEFTQYLREIVDASFAAGPPPPEPSPGRDRQTDAEPKAAQAACATCKGDCCNLGGEQNAFLNADIISEYRSLNPNDDADQVYEAYHSRLADEMPENSCQFHGPKGCTLDRAHRADICNLHHCRALKYLLHMDGVIGDSPLALIALDEEGDGLEASFVDGDDWRRVDTTGASDVSPDQRDWIVQSGLDWLPDVSPMIQPIHRPNPPAPTCHWCGDAIGINQAARGQSCGAPGCEQRRVQDLARKSSPT